MTTAATKTTLTNAVERVLGAEKITRKDMTFISREGMLFVWETHDIDQINRLISSLTPVNRKVAIEFFKHFLAHDQEKDKDGNHVRFGKMHKSGKRVETKLKLTNDFLADESNNIWTWASDNIDLSKKKDFAAMVERAVKAALKGDEKTDTPPLSPSEIMLHVISAGVSIEELMNVAEAVKHQNAEAEMKVINPEPAQTAA